MPGPVMPLMEQYDVVFDDFGALQFTDMREVVDEDRRALARQAFRQALIFDYEDQMGSGRHPNYTGLCDFDAAKNGDIYAGFTARYLEEVDLGNPGYNWDDYEQEGGTYTGDHMLDPRRNHWLIEVRTLGGPPQSLGMIQVMNIDVTDEGAGDVEWSIDANVVPGVIPLGGISPVASIAVFMLDAVSRTYSFDGGLTVDIGTVKLPTDNHRFWFKPEPYNDLHVLNARASTDPLVEVDYLPGEPTVPMAFRQIV